jgi:capsular polysaccharide transport system permease protein
MSNALETVRKTSFDAVPSLPVRRLAPGRNTADRAPWLRMVKGGALFAIIVFIPTLVATIYFTCVAANQYASETRFLVRSPQRASAGLISGFLQSTGFVRAQDDSYAATEFIKSRDAVARLIEKYHLRDVLSRPEADIWTRFPGIWSNDTSEALFRSYLRFVKVQTDSASGISTLEVRAFRADDARNITLALLEESEELVNRLNDRARRDAILAGQREVEASEGGFADVQQQLTAFRNREAMIDPDKQATSELELISRLSLDAVEKRARVYEIERQAPASPQIPALKASIAAVEVQIARERDRVAGSNASIAPRLSQYEGLLLQRELAARRINSASASLETARLDAQRQQLYIERIVEPHLPDHATYPKAAFLIIMTFVVALSAYLTINALSHYLRDHAEP